MKILIYQLVVIFIFCLSLFSCPSSQVNYKTADITLIDEVRYSKEILQKIRRDYPAYQNAEVQTYISKIGSQIIKSNNIENTVYEFSFTVVDVPSINAFAAPAGKIFITRPLLAMIDTEAELAGIIGHEIAHVQLRHAIQRIRNSENTKSESWMYGSGGLAVGGTLGAILASIICQDNSGICSQNLVGVFSSSGLTSALLIQKYNFFANNQKNEIDADRLGFELAINAGYNKVHIGDFYRKLEKILNMKKQSAEKMNAYVVDSMSTHPVNEKRVQLMNELTLLQAQKPTKGIISTAEFNNFKKLL